jgi:hypothetical protein
MSEWKFPALEVGMTVLWYENGDPGGRAIPGVLSRVPAKDKSSRSLCVHLFDRASDRSTVKDPVRLLDDPLANKEDFKNHGGVRLTDSTKAILEALEMPAKFQDFMDKVLKHMNVQDAKIKELESVLLEPARS